MTRHRSVILTAGIVFLAGAWILVLALLTATGVTPVEGVSPLAAAVPGVLSALVYLVLGYFILQEADWTGLFALVGVLAGLVAAVAAVSVTPGPSTLFLLLVLLGLLVLLFIPDVRSALNPLRKRPIGVTLVGAFYFVKFYALMNLVIMSAASILAPDASAPGFEPAVAWALLPVGLGLMGLTFAAGMGLASLRPWGWILVVGLHWFSLAASVGLLLVAVAMDRMEDSGDWGQVVGGLLYLGIILVYLYRPKVRQAFQPDA